MSVYIKGMEMPKNCAYCRFLQSEGTYPRNLYCGVYNLLTIDRKDYAPIGADCPLLPVPDHGALKDADAAERHLIKMQQAQKDTAARGVRKSRAVLRDLPIIIPADKEDGE